VFGRSTSRTRREEAPRPKGPQVGCEPRSLDAVTSRTGSRVRCPRRSCPGAAE
jgi:hypothetical protein